jgi:hypothetical protein
VVTLSAHKFNAQVPDTSIPGATYDLYVEGSGPPATSPTTPPANAASEPGDTWYSRGTTDASGNLSFTVPAGYAWCLAEQSAPTDYLPDTGLHCSSTLTTSSPASATTIALPETVATVYVSAHKYNSLQPGTVIAGATYALMVQGPAPADAPTGAPTSGPGRQPAGMRVPTGDTYWTQGTTDAQGLLSFAVPAGSSWCLIEVTAPAGYEPDPATHCTGVLTTQTSAAAASLALPELPVPAGALAFTGGPSIWLAISGLLLVMGGFGLLVIKRRLSVEEVPEEGGRPSRSGALVDGVDQLAQSGKMPLVEAQGQAGQLGVIIT